MRIKMFLPISFTKNTFERMLQYLNESNRIEGIQKVDYFKHEQFLTPAQGHFGALVDSQDMALEAQPLSIRKIKHWQALLTREQIALGEHIEENEIGHIRNDTLPKNVRVGRHIPPHYSRVPALLERLVEQINEQLRDQKKLQDDLEYCKFLGWAFQQFESIHPFVDGNGRTGRLLANYIATYCQRPMIVFNSEIRERNRYYNAHISSGAMARFMAFKVQEVIFSWNGDGLLFKKVESGASIIYQSADGKHKEIYEWHSILPLLSEEVDEEQKVELPG